MSKRLIVTGLILSGCHLVISLSLVTWTYAAGMAKFDTGEKSTWVEQVADGALHILMQPGLSAWTPWMSRHMPGILEWPVFLGNSLLWGFALAAAVLLLRGKPKTP